jgi:hypothetical protein
MAIRDKVIHKEGRIGDDEVGSPLHGVVGDAEGPILTPLF